MKYLFFSLVLVFGFFLSCRNKGVQFYLDYDAKVTVESSVPINVPFTLNTPEQETNSTFEFEVNNTRKDLIETILLENLTISIVAPDQQNFNFLNSLEVFIDAENFTEQKIAFKENIPSNVNVLECEVLDIDLQEYIKEETFSIRLNTVTDQIITNDIELNIYSNFFVDAKIFK
jgi:hypothetical protein